MTFDEWRCLLFEDAQKHNKTEIVEIIGDIVLKIFYEDGTEPSINGLSGISRDAA